VVAAHALMRGDPLTLVEYLDGAAVKRTSTAARRSLRPSRFSWVQPFLLYALELRLATISRIRQSRIFA
jgi:hypothetical protein